MYDNLYIHVPFCRSKCAYCAFYSLVGAEPAERRRYLDGLRRDLRAAADGGRLSPKTIYIGGGTPTIFDEDELADLMRLIETATTPSATNEFTIECNPETLTDATCVILEAGGVTRVSLGAQSFNPGLRKLLGRAGEMADMYRAVDALREHGFENLNVDLIYGIPGQSLSDWRDDLRRACALPITHLSTYALTLEEGSLLAAGDAIAVDDDLAADMWELTDEIAGRHGLRRYEVSNFSLPTRECRHNDAIWHGATYLGCGPAASSFDGAKRWSNVANLRQWLAGAPPETSQLSAERQACEILAFGMRTRRGWNLDEFRRIAGHDALELRGEAITHLVRRGLVELGAETLRPTPGGLLFADSVAVELL